MLKLCLQFENRLKYIHASLIGMKYKWTAYVCNQITLYTCGNMCTNMPFKIYTEKRYM